ncbi:MAG: ankyrin repeat domain-containing protein [Coxiellaceae bacterium]|nr:ankyrin repeat domain-containing protein [Coxiellaceae bacterium]
MSRPTTPRGVKEEKIDPDIDIPPMPPAYFFKSVRIDTQRNNWTAFIKAITKSCVNNRKGPALRKPRAFIGDLMTAGQRPNKYTIKLFNNSSHEAVPIITRSFPSKVKRGHSKPQSLTYCKPGTFEPPIYGTENSTPIHVGVMLKPSDVLVNRILKYDLSTYHRPFEHQTQEEAEAFKKHIQHLLFDSHEDLVDKTSDTERNETLARVKSCSCDLAIFKDNLPSRIMAAHLANVYRSRLRQVEREEGLRPNSLPDPTIIFYLPKSGSDKHFTEYTPADQEADRRLPSYEATAKKLSDDHLFPQIPVDYIKQYASTELHLAAARGDTQRVAELTTPEASRMNYINSTDWLGRTALHYAMENGHIDTTLTLLNHPNIQVLPDHNDDCYILSALKNGALDEVTTFLSKHPHAYEKLNYRQFTNILSYCSLKMYNQLFTDALVKFQSRFTVIDKAEILLEAALTTDNDVVAEALIPYVINVDHKPSPRKIDYMIHNAIKSGKVEVLATIVTTTEKDLQKDNFSYLHLATSPAPSAPMIKYLLDQGVGSSGVAQSRFDEYITQCLEHKNEACAQLLIDYAITHSIKIQSRHYHPTLNLAAQLKYTDVALKLLNYGVNQDQVSSENDSKQTPLHYAVKYKDHKLALALIDKGASVDKKNTVGNTPFCLAIQNNDLEMAQTLLNNGAGINIKPKHGLPPLFTAIMRRKIPTVNFLLDNDIDTRIVNHKNENALQYIDRKVEELARLPEEDKDPQEANDLQCMHKIIRTKMDEQQDSTPSCTIC